MFGDGNQSRCFTWVGDVVDALIALSRHPDAVGEVFNVGSTEEVSIGALAELVKAKTQSASPIVCVPYDEAYEQGFEDMPRRLPNLAKIRGLIGYEPSLDLHRILDEIIKYYRALPRERW